MIALAILVTLIIGLYWLNDLPYLRSHKTLPLVNNSNAPLFEQSYSSHVHSYFHLCSWHKLGDLVPADLLSSDARPGPFSL